MTTKAERVTKYQPAKAGEAKARVRTITPQMAKKWLKTSENANVRHINQNRVFNLARLILDGKWVISNDAITLDRFDQVINGQHRLAACVAADVPIQALVLKGAVDPVVFDQGHRRTAGQVLQRLGYKNTNVLASAAHWALIHDWYDMKSIYSTTYESKPQVQEIIEFVQNNDDLSLFASMASNGRLNRIMSASNIAFVCFCAADVDRDKAIDFMTCLVKGGYSENTDSELPWVNSPAHALRERMIRERRSKGRSRIRREHMVALMVKAWNLFVRDISCQKLSVGPRERPEFETFD